MNFSQNNTIGIEEDQALMKQRKFLQKKADISVAQSETTIIKKVGLATFISKNFPSDDLKHFTIRRYTLQCLTYKRLGPLIVVYPRTIGWSG